MPSTPRGAQVHLLFTQCGRWGWKPNLRQSETYLWYLWQKYTQLTFTLVTGLAEPTKIQVHIHITWWSPVVTWLSALIIMTFKDNSGVSSRPVQCFFSPPTSRPSKFSLQGGPHLACKAGRVCWLLHTFSCAAASFLTTQWTCWAPWEELLFSSRTMNSKPC